jgi:pimeloyl-ACP methyl ester carboxylesterase
LTEPGSAAFPRFAAALAGLLGPALLAGCRAERPPGAAAARPTPAAAFADRSPHREMRVEANGVRLATLDWGGTGPPLVMLHGIGDNPHIFDDLARRLRGDFRVVAYARRGHGDSDAPAGPYDLPTLVEDLRQLMDRLELPRASLLGWSMGGNEITMFAGHHPERVEKLVYLESGFDWSESKFLKPFGSRLAAISPDEAALSSLDAYRTLFREAWLGEAPWSDGLEAYLRNTVRVAGGGSLEVIPRQSVFEACFASLAAPPRDYGKVRAPALSLYSTTFFPTSSGDARFAGPAREFEEGVMVPFRAASIDRLRRELRGARTLEIPGTTHMSIGVQDPDGLAATIREFLLGAGR